MSMINNCSIPPFMCKTLPVSELRDSWNRWLRGLENVLAVGKITKSLEKRNHLLAFGGLDLQDVFYSIPGADVACTEEDADEIDPYAVAIDKLNSYFAPKHHEAYERYLFWSLNPNQNEPIEKFLLRVQNQAMKCQFGKSKSESQQNSIIDKIVLWAPSELREKLLQKPKLTLDIVTKTVNAHQAIKFQSGQISSNTNRELEVNKMYDRPSVSNSREQQELCSRCGRQGHKSFDKTCPARNEKCHKCGKVGHYFRNCKTRDGFKRTHDQSNQFDRSNANKRPKLVRLVKDDDDNSNGHEESKHSVYNVNEADDLIWCKVGGVPIEMLIDSGSTYNLIDDKTWSCMRQNGVQVFNERFDSNKKFMAYGKFPLNLLTVFDAELIIEDTNNLIKVQVTFYVIEKGQQPLLGKVTAKALGLLSIGLPSSTKACDTFQVDTKSRVFPKIKGIQIRIPINPTVKPVQQPIRRCPIALTKPMKQKLNELLEMDIIEKVSEASSWVSPLVPVLKGNGDLRICVDMRRANMAVIRENHPLPTMDDLFARLGKAVYFSQLDLKNGFHQCELHLDSRSITTFISPWGMFRYKRLVFGINCAPELFQKILEQILSECENTINYIDDIIIFGRTEKEHDNALTKVLSVLKSRDVLLNSQKCKFKVKRITFMGHTLSESGIEPAIDKVESIKRCRSPKTREELRSFLGLVTFVARYIPDLATLNAPLRELLKDSVPFVWLSEHEKSFLKIKEIMGDVKSLGYFDQNDKTLVVADASGVALGAILIQFDKLNQPRIISYASKSLSACEKRFSQTEKEALALVWAVERFKLYLLGIQFDLETDHKPLEVIFGKTSRPCARIERWVLRLQAFNYKVIYRRGKTNLADVLSRLPVGNVGVPFEEKSDVYIRAAVCVISSMIVNNSDETFDNDVEASVRAIHESAALDVMEIEMATETDPDLQEVRKCIESGKWDNVAVKNFAHFKEEFGFTGNLILRNSKLVIPKILRSRMLELGHEGHPGESAMKARLRERCWWPKIDADIQKYVAQCSACQLVALPERPEPMSRKPLPLKPWIDLALDFLGPLPTGESILVVVDYFSR